MLLKEIIIYAENICVAWGSSTVIFNITFYEEYRDPECEVFPGNVIFFQSPAHPLHELY